MPKPEPLDFNQALAFLRHQGHPLTPWSFRREVQRFPERFKAFRRNSLKVRGKGGKLYFYKSNLEKYTSLTPIK